MHPEKKPFAGIHEAGNSMKQNPLREPPVAGNPGTIRTYLSLPERNGPQPLPQAHGIPRYPLWLAPHPL